VNQRLNRPQQQMTVQNRGRGTGASANRSNQTRVFEMRRPDALNAHTTTCTIWIKSKSVHILFDTGATHSYMSSACTSRLGLTCIEGVSFVVGLPHGSRVSGDREIRQCPIRIGGRDWFANFIVIKLSPDDDVILGMDWMRHYRVVINAHDGTVTVTADDGTLHVCLKSESDELGLVINMVKAAKLLSNGCVGY